MRRLLSWFRRTREDGCHLWRQLQQQQAHTEEIDRWLGGDAYVTERWFQEHGR